MNKTLQNAYVAATTAAASNEIRALVAEREGCDREALLFRTLKRAQEVQAKKLLLLMREKPGDTETNLAAAKAEAEAMAASLGNLDGFSEITADALERMRRVSMGQAARAGNTSTVGERMHVCLVCGFVAGDPAPERCPICNAVGKKLQPVE